MENYPLINQQELVCAVSSVIQRKSVACPGPAPYPYGADVNECLEYVLSLAGSFGFETCNMEGYCGWCEYGEGEEMVAVLGHLDVVPAGDGWTFEPFGGEVSNGRIYGRGATDDKGPIITALYALKAIKDAGIKLKRRVRIIFGCGEEIGCEDMDWYISHGGEIPVTGFTPDGEFPLINGEKGLVTEYYTCRFPKGCIAKMEGGSAVNMVPNKAYALLSDGRHRITLDEAIAVMMETGKALSNKFKETSQGGLATVAKQ